MPTECTAKLFEFEAVEGRLSFALYGANEAVDE